MQVPQALLLVPRIFWAYTTKPDQHHYIFPSVRAGPVFFMLCYAMLCYAMLCSPSMLKWKDRRCLKLTSTLAYQKNYYLGTEYTHEAFVYFRSQFVRRVYYLHQNKQKSINYKLRIQVNIATSDQTKIAHQVDKKFSYPPLRFLHRFNPSKGLRRRLGRKIHYYSSE